MKKTKIFYLDTETTGVNPKQNDITQLAFVIEIDGKEVCEKNFLCQPFNFAAINEEALAKQGRTVEQLKNFPHPTDVYQELVKTLEKYVDPFDKADKFYPAGYNVKFDVSFLSEFFFKNGNKYYGSWFNWKLVDPFPLLHLLDSMGHISLCDYKLGTVCRHFNLTFKAHDALEDIRATIELIKILKEQYLVGGKPCLS